MRVILICGAGIVSGKEIMTLHLFREMKRRGHECFCIVSSWGSIDFRSRLTEIGVPFYNLRIGFISKTLTWSAIRMTMIQVFYLPGLLWKYASLNRRLKPDVVIHTNFHHTFLLYPVLGKTRSIYWSHEIIANTNFYQKLFILFRKKINLFIGVSKAVSHSLENLISREKVITIRNGVDVPTNFKAVETNNVAIRFAIVGQISRNKGHDLLFKALANFITGSKRIHLKVVGSGDPVYIEHLNSLAADLGLATYIEWTGFIEDPNEIYKDIDWIIVPTISPEPLGLVVLEAALRGIPAIASNTGGLPELINDGLNGFLFVPGDCNCLQSSIERVMQLTEKEILRLNTIRFANENFTLEKFSDEFDKVLMQVTSPELLFWLNK
jgi:glycosyltransferase involved in cell wall biosynthesis